MICGLAAPHQIEWMPFHENLDGYTLEQLGINDDQDGPLGIG
jgi:hypothetical protein